MYDLTLIFDIRAGDIVYMIASKNGCAYKSTVNNTIFDSMHHDYWFRHVIKFDHVDQDKNKLMIEIMYNLMYPHI